MSVFGGHTYYVLKSMEFASIVGERIKQLEVDRVLRIIQLAELDALRGHIPDSDLKAWEHDRDVVFKQVEDIDIRIEAIRALCTEYDLPKAE